MAELVALQRLPHNVQMANSDIVYRCQQALGHKQAAEEVWLTVISIAAGDVSDQGQQDQQECYCLCYL